MRPTVILFDVNETLLDMSQGQSLYPLSPKPQFTGKDLVDIANAIIKCQAISS